MCLFVVVLKANKSVTGVAGHSLGVPFILERLQQARLAAAAKEDELLRLANQCMGGGAAGAAATVTTHEDVRDDGKSAGARFGWKNTHTHGESQQ